MYHNYFGLKEPAFSIAVNPRYLYMSQQHKEALAHLLYGVQGGGFVMLSGEVGTGKTTIIRCLLEQLPENTEIAIVLNPMADALEILGTVCDELGIEYDKGTSSIKVLTDLLQERLLENHRSGRNTVLLIDEAQLLAADVLEQIRLLTNLETTTEKLLQIVLVGQPELNALLSQPRLRQLSQRITARFHLKPLSVEETWAYISHRLSVAGMQEDRNPFTPRIIKRIHAFTGGIPRKINILCERILIGAYGHNQSTVDNKVFQLAQREVTGHTEDETKNTDGWMWKFFAVASSACLIIVLALMFTRNPSQPLSTPEPTGAVVPKVIESPTETAKSAPTEENIGAQNPEDLIEESIAASPLFDIASVAQESLFKYLNIPVDSNSYPCWQLAERNIECKRARFSSWDEFFLINRPAVLTLTDASKLKHYAVISGVEGNNALLLDTKSQPYTRSLEELGPMWSGEVFYIWRRPDGFTDALTKGQRSRTIAWVAQQFATLDKQDEPLTNSYFNEKLEQRIKIFQRNHNLADDGIVGEQTLMKLNDAMGIDKTLVNSSSES